MIMIVMICLRFIIASPESRAESGKSEMTESIFERVDINVGAPTNTVLPLNLDDDNYLDLLAVGNDQVIILRGIGNGQFNITGYVPAGENAVDLASADIDEDGFLDLAVANHNTEYITLLFGNSASGFDKRSYSQMSVNVSPHPHMVKLNDLNGDSHIDLLVDDRNAEALRFFPGRGDGSFENPIQIPVGGDPYRGISLVDVNKDGNLDIISPNPDHVSILTGNGSGEFTQETVLYPGFGPFSATADDFNGDGVMDITAASGEGPGVLTVWFGNTDGSFAAKVNYELASGPTRIATGDLTNDGKAEIVVTSYIGGEVAVLISKDEPVLNRIVTGGDPYGVSIGDFNNDKRNDFIIANEETQYVTLFLSDNNTTGVKESSLLLDDFILYQNYPNPFNPSTTIQYSIHTPAYGIPSREGKERSDRGVLVTIKVYNNLGIEVTTLVNETKQPGTYEIEFNAAGFSSGIYYYRLTVGNYSETKKMILIK